MLLHEFIPIKVLADGKFSLIFKVKSRRDADAGREYAMKRYYLMNHFAINQALTDYRVLRRLNSSPSVFFPTLFYARRAPWSVALVMEQCSELDLRKLRDHVLDINEDVARFYVAEIVHALSHLHDRGIIHMDLKLSNTLLTHGGHIKLTDFGLSCFEAELANLGRSEMFRGTINFIAPEVANRVAVTKKADIWCLAALITNLIGVPFRNPGQEFNKQLEQALRGSWNRRILNVCSPSLKELLTACLKLEHEKRPDVASIKTMSWFRETDWDSVAKQETKPPFNPQELCEKNDEISKKKKKTVEEYSREIILLFLADSPGDKDRRGKYRKEFGHLRVDKEALKQKDLTPDAFDEIFFDYEYTHPDLQDRFFIACTIV